MRSNKSGRDGVTYSRCFPHLKQPLLVCPLKKYGIFWEFCPKPLLQRGRGTEPTALRVTRPKLQQLNQNQNLCYTKNNPEITKKTTKISLTKSPLFFNRGGSIKGGWGWGSDIPYFWRGVPKYASNVWNNFSGRTTSPGVPHPAQATFGLWKEEPRE